MSPDAGVGSGDPPESSPASRRAARDVVVDLLIGYRYWIGLALILLAIAGAAGILLLGWSIPAIEVPRQVKLILVGLLASVMIGFVPARMIVDWLHSPPRVHVVNLGLRESEDPAIWRLSPSAWAAVDVVEGDIHRWTGTTWPTVEVESFDPDALEAVGTWRGSASDRELLEAEKKVEVVRAELEAEANRSIDLQLTVSSRVRQAVKSIGERIIDVHASAATYEGEAIADVLEDVRSDVEDDQGDDVGDGSLASAVDEAAIDGLEQAAATATDGGTET